MLLVAIDPGSNNESKALQTGEQGETDALLIKTRGNRGRNGGREGKEGGHECRSKMKVGNQRGGEQVEEDGVNALGRGVVRRKACQPTAENKLECRRRRAATKGGGESHRG